MRRFLACLLVASAASACTETPPSGDLGDSLVSRVVDGDTALIVIDGGDVRVRFIGIDAPESVAPEQSVECLGPEAAAFVADRLEGERVRLEFDVEREDRFGRTLAYLWLGDELFNETIVREGLAVVTTFPPNVRYVDRFVAAQLDARAESRAVWGRCR